MNTLAELHLHLDGSLRPETLLALALEQGVALPSWDIRFSPGMTLHEALSRFEVTLGVLQHPPEVRRVAREMCEDAAATGIDTLEIRFAPQLHKGAPIEAIIDAALEGIDGRAGLILCGLYGEDPAIYERLLGAASTRKGVVGIDLAGGPSSGDDFRLEDYAEAFKKAERMGLGRTVHAGEGRPPQEIRAAIEVLRAQRIGHGTTLLGDPSLVDLILARGVTIEACPSSNLHTGAIAQIADHPIGRWIELGIKVCVCADNTLFSTTDAAREIDLLRAQCGLSDEAISTAIASGHAARFDLR